LSIVYLFCNGILNVVHYGTLTSLDEIELLLARVWTRYATNESQARDRGLKKKKIPIRGITSVGSWGKSEVASCCQCHR